MARFEIAKGYENKDIHLPVRKTACAAGYDFEVAEDIVIPSYTKQMDALIRTGWSLAGDRVDLNQMAELTKKSAAKPTLVPTGIKCKLEPDTYLALTVRSSAPLKYWIILANSEGIVDADYYGSATNYGAIFFQCINLSPFDIVLHKGDIIGQGIIMNYIKTEDDIAEGVRTGGFGSTSA